MIATVLLATGLGAALQGNLSLAKDFWEIGGSFGRAVGAVRETPRGWTTTGETYRVETTVERDDASGVSVRRTVLENISDRPISARCLMDRFLFLGGDWEVYTQANSWGHESRGGWQPLVTGVASRGPSVRSTQMAAPMLAIWNVQEKRGRVFHLLTDGAWEMHAERAGGQSESMYVTVDVGYDSRHLDYPLQPGGKIALPEVLYYDFENRTDFDCHRLHAYWNARYPAKGPLPVVYDTWLARWDRLELGFVLRQVEQARKIGIDHFVVDAGWYGSKKGWGAACGDWEESPDGWLGGRLGEVAQAVRAAGMKFGLWLEPSRANRDSKIVKAHPDWFFSVRGAIYFDFTKREAFESIVGTVCALVKKYGIELIEFDYNQGVDIDPSGRAFIDYNRAYRRFIAEVRRRNPGILVQGCASGGMMLDLGWARDFDLMCTSDNLNPYEGLRIIKETMLRLPPRLNMREICVTGVREARPDEHGNRERLLATEDSGWLNMRAVGVEYLEALAAGGPHCFSCDLTDLTDAQVKRLASSVAARKRDAAFWSRAVGRILCDSPTFTVFQYDDGTLDEVRLVAVPETPLQTAVAVHPVLTPGATYRLGEKTLTSAQIAAEGIILGRGARIGSGVPSFVTLRKVAEGGADLSAAK